MKPYETFQLQILERGVIEVLKETKMSYNDQDIVLERWRTTLSPLDKELSCFVIFSLKFDKRKDEKTLLFCTSLLLDDFRRMISFNNSLSSEGDESNIYIKDTSSLFSVLILLMLIEITSKIYFITFIKIKFE